jgi:hypothetical protein
MAAQVQHCDERASQFEDKRYVARGLARASENTKKGVDQKAPKQKATRCERGSKEGTGVGPGHKLKKKGV